MTTNTTAQNTRCHDSNQHTHMGWLFATESPWTQWHTGGSRQDTHGTPVPTREGRGGARHKLHDRTTDKRQHDKRQVCVKRAFRKQNADRHLYTCTFFFFLIFFVFLEFFLGVGFFVASFVFFFFFFQKFLLIFF